MIKKKNSNKKQQYKDEQPIELEEKLQKKSTNFFIGFQPKIFKIMGDGTQIAYKNLNEEFFSSEKTFDLKYISTSEDDQENVFFLQTPKRKYELRAEDLKKRNLWMKTIAKFQKKLKKKEKTKYSEIVRQHEMVINDTTSSSLMKTQNNINDSLMNPLGSGVRFSTIKQPSFSPYNYKYKEQVGKIKSQYLSAMKPQIILYHTYITRISQKSESFMSNEDQTYYILFSSKTLYPEIYLSDDNLRNNDIPHWADLNRLFKLGQDSMQHQGVLNVGQISKMEEDQNYCLLRVWLEGSLEVRELYCDSLDQRKKLMEILETARINAKECTVGGKYFRKNYDRLILLRSTNFEQFTLKVNDLVQSFIPQSHQFEFPVLKKLLDQLAPLIMDITIVLENKIENSRKTLVSFLELTHDIVRSNLKLTWDSSNYNAKGGDILNVLKGISRYENLVNKYVNDLELNEAMKELSKMYVRTSYGNFESIIISVVEQQKKGNYYTREDEDEPYLETHGITDLFKFIYDVFNLAMPCWNNRLHLHNINKLVRKAIEVYLTEMKSMVDEEEICQQQLIGIANNYFRFREEIQEFYKDKFGDLKEKTKEYYDKLQNDYRELSLVIVDRLVLPLKIQLKIHFEKQEFTSTYMQLAYDIIMQSSINAYLAQMHPIFRRRYYERVFGCIKEQIGKMLEKEAKKINKKKRLDRVVQQIQSFKEDCVEMAQSFTCHKSKVAKDFDEILMVLRSNKKQQIKSLIRQSTDLFKRIYLKILNLRPDYSESNPFYSHIEDEEFLRRISQQYLSIDSPTEVRRSTFTKYYMQDLDRGSIQSVFDKGLQKPFEKYFQDKEEDQEKIWLISEGYVNRKKGENYEKIFIKLQKSILFIYETQTSQRCHNTISLEDLVDLVNPPQKLTLTIAHKALNRQKELKMKFDTMEDKNRWVYTLQLEMKRINNDKKKDKGKVKIKEKKSKLVIDYKELEGFKDFFSYKDE